VATAHDTVTYVSRCGAGARAGDAPAPCADPVFRTLVRAERLVAGDHPTDPVHPAVAGESSSAASLAGALVAGRLRAFDRAVFYETRYPLAEETLDGGDVVRLESGTGSATPRGRTAGVAEAGGRAASEAAAGASKNEDEAPAHATDDASLVWGSVTARFEEGDPHGSALQLVAHTRRHQVRVDRFGGGYLFGATRWDVLSSQPMVQAVWLGLVSFFLVVSGLQALRERVAPPDEGARADALAPASRLDTPAQPPGHAADADAVARWDGQGSETGPPAAAAVTGDARGAADDTAEAREEEEGRDARMRRPA